MHSWLVKPKINSSKNISKLFYIKPKYIKPMKFTKKYFYLRYVYVCPLPISLNEQNLIMFIKRNIGESMVEGS